MAAAVVVFLIGAPALWRIGASLGHIAANIITGSAYIAGLATAFVPVFVTVLCLIVTGSGILLIIMILGIIGKKIDHLAKELSRNVRETARNVKETAFDAGFVAVVGIVSALVAYLSTNDFLENASTLKVFAAAAVCYAALKVLMLIPVRSIQVLAAGLMLGVFGVSIGLLNSRHPILPLANMARLAQSFWVADFPRKVTAGAIGLLTTVSLLYPFTLKAWKRILSR